MDNQEIEDFLCSTPPFSCLEHKHIQRIVQVVEIHEMGRQESLFVEGDSADYLWVVADGLVCITAPRPGGGRLTLEVLKRGELFGISSLVNQPTYTASALAVSAAVTYAVPRAVVLHYLHSSGAFATETTVIVTSRVLDSHTMRLLDFGLVEQRLAYALLGLCQKAGRQFPLTRREVADIAGTRPETTIRYLSQWQKQGILGEAPRGWIHINDPNQLTQLSGHPVGK